MTKGVGILHPWASQVQNGGGSEYRGGGGGGGS